VGWNLVASIDVAQTHMTGMVAYAGDFDTKRLWFVTHTTLGNAYVWYYDYGDFPLVIKTFSGSPETGDMIVFKDELYVEIGSKIYKYTLGSRPFYAFEEVKDFGSGHVRTFGKTSGDGVLVAALETSGGIELYSTTNGSDWTLEWDDDDWVTWQESQWGEAKCHSYRCRGIAVHPYGYWLYALMEFQADAGAETPPSWDYACDLIGRSVDGDWGIDGSPATVEDLKWLEEMSGSAGQDPFKMYFGTAPFYGLGQIGHIYSAVGDGTYVTEYTAGANNTIRDFYYFYGKVFACGACGASLSTSGEAYKKNGAWASETACSMAGELRIGIDGGMTHLCENPHDGALYCGASGDDAGTVLYKREPDEEFAISIPSKVAGRALDVSKEDGTRIHIAGLNASSNPLAIMVPSSMDAITTLDEGTSGSPMGIVSEWDDHDDVYFYGTIDGSPIRRSTSGSTFANAGSEFSGQICRNVLVHELAAGSPVALTSDGEAWESDDRAVSFHKQGDIGFDPLGADREPEDTIWTGRFGISGSAVMKLSEDTGQSFSKRDTNLPTTNYVSDVVIEP